MVDRTDIFYALKNIFKLDENPSEYQYAAIKSIIWWRKFPVKEFNTGSYIPFIDKDMYIPGLDMTFNTEV